jgi:hypothetical protein
MDLSKSGRPRMVAGDKMQVDPRCPGAGRAKLRLSRGFPRRTRPRRHPLNHSIESTTMCAAIGVARQKMGDAEIQPHVRAP